MIKVFLVITMVVLGVAFHIGNLFHGNPHDRSLSIHLFLSMLITLVLWRIMERVGDVPWHSEIWVIATVISMFVTFGYFLGVGPGLS